MSFFASVIGECFPLKYFTPSQNSVGEYFDISLQNNEYHKEVYEKNIKLEFIKFIREEKKFSSLEQLKQQILQDISNCGLKF